jgi:hypothetical protein
MTTTRSTSVTVVMFDEKMYRGNGLVKKWMDKIMFRFRSEAMRACPKRTGRLMSTIGSSSTTTGPRSVQGFIHVGGPKAPYADFVMRGTEGPIMSNKAYKLKLGFTYDQYPHYLMPVPGGLRYQVRGQKANNFLFKAWDRTARDHSSIRRTGSGHLGL